MSDDKTSLIREGAKTVAGEFFNGLAVLVILAVVAIVIVLIGAGVLVWKAVS